MTLTGKRGFKFYVNIYGKILVQDFKSKMSYRADFIISNIGMIISNLVGFETFYILFRNFPSINGWTMYEMLFMYGFSLIALSPLQCFFDNNWNLRYAVKTGDFIKYCFRPINIFFYYIYLKILMLRDWASWPLEWEPWYMPGSILLFW